MKEERKLSIIVQLVATKLLIDLLGRSPLLSLLSISPRSLSLSRSRGNTPVSVDILHLACINFADGVRDSCLRPPPVLWRCLSSACPLLSRYMVHAPCHCIRTCRMVFPRLRYFLLSIEIPPPPKVASRNCFTMDKTECALVMYLLLLAVIVQEINFGNNFVSVPRRTEGGGERRAISWEFWET